MLQGPQNFMNVHETARWPNLAFCSVVYAAKVAGLQVILGTLTSYHYSDGSLWTCQSVPSDVPCSQTRQGVLDWSRIGLPKGNTVTFKTSLGALICVKSKYPSWQDATNEISHVPLTTTATLGLQRASRTISLDTEFKWTSVSTLTQTKILFHNSSLKSLFVIKNIQ